MKIVRSKKSVVLLSQGIAIKQYRRRFRALASIEADRNRVARSGPCREWVVPTRQIAGTALLLSERGNPAPRDASLQAVSRLVQTCIWRGSFVPAQASLGLPEVQRILSVLDLDLRLHIEERFRVDASLRLPFGATHGDVHIDNVVEVRGTPMVIDWLSYRGRGCPLWDITHFYYEEARLARGANSWLDVISSVDLHDIALVRRFAGQHVRSFLYTYALQRIAREAVIKSFGSSFVDSATTAKRKLAKFIAEADRLP